MTADFDLNTGRGRVSQASPSAYAALPSSPYSHILSTEVTMAVHTRSGRLWSLSLQNPPFGGLLSMELNWNPI